MRVNNNYNTHNFSNNMETLSQVHFLWYYVLLYLRWCFMWCCQPLNVQYFMYPILQWPHINDWYRDISAKKKTTMYQFHDLWYYDPLSLQWYVIWCLRLLKIWIWKWNIFQSTHINGHDRYNSITESMTNLYQLYASWEYTSLFMMVCYWMLPVSHYLMLDASHTEV